MFAIQKLPAAAASALLFLSGAMAQSISVPPGPLQSGATIEIGFSDPAQAGKTVTITGTSNGYPSGESETVDITLDSTGNGTTAIEVPKWGGINFNGGGADQVSRAIQ